MRKVGRREGEKKMRVVGDEGKGGGEKNIGKDRENVGIREGNGGG